MTAFDPNWMTESLKKCQEHQQQRNLYDPKAFSCFSSASTPSYNFCNPIFTNEKLKSFFEVECTLEELYKGATKEVHVVVMQKNQYGLLIPLTKSFNIDIKAGFHAGTKYTFTGHGDLVHENQYKDIVFVLKEKQHPVFQRSKHDLILTLPVSLKCSSMFFNVKLLDGSNKDFFWQKELALNELRYDRMGMPKSKDAGKVGDLVVRFQTIQ